MHPALQEHVLPLVGQVKLEGFDQTGVGHVLGLQMKIVKHINSRNSEKLKMYLAFCVQEWPSVKVCPIDRQIIKEALDIIS